MKKAVTNWLFKKGIVFLPIKVGQSVWTAYPFVDGMIREGHITCISLSYDGIDEYGVGYKGVPLADAFSPEDIGKTYFLSKEEAERTLRENKKWTMFL